VTDPRREPDLPFAPQPIHDPVHPIEGEPGGTTNDVLFCPDCLLSR
jgi:hypothetical protein